MGQFQSLSDSEMEIMRVIWDAGESVTAAQLLELFAHKGWKIQTVSTFLSRLVEKGVLSVERRGRSNFYTPAVTEQGYHKLEARRLVNEHYHGDVLDFLAAFYGGEPLKKEELDSLRRWFEQEAEHAD